MASRLLPAIMIPVMLTLMVACSNLVKTKMYSSANYQDTSRLPVFPDGATYYLPKKYLKVTVTRKPIPADKVKASKLAVENAKADLEKLNVRARAAKEAAQLQEAVAKEATGDAKKTAQEKAALLAAEHRVIQGQADRAERNITTLEEIANAAVVAKDAVKFEDDIILTELPSVPDTTNMFVARLNHWVTHEDKLFIKVNKLGLLETITGEEKDKTPEIIQDAGKVAIAAFKAAAGMPAPGPGTFGRMNQLSTTDLAGKFLGFEGSQVNETLTERNTKEYRWTCKSITSKITTTKFSHEFTFDPADRDSISDLNKKLCQLDTQFRVIVKPEKAPQSKELIEEQEKAFLPVRPGQSPELKGGMEEKGMVAPKGIDVKDLTDGLVYRSPIPYTIDLAQIIGDDVFSIKSSQVILPNKGPLSIISMETGAFVTTNYDIGFEDGMLTKLDIKRPSEVHALIQVPLVLVREVIALPTDLLQLRLDYSTKDTALLESQKKRVEAQQDLRKTLEDLGKTNEDHSEETVNKP